MSKVIGYSRDGCIQCEAVKADMEDVKVFMVWKELEGSTIPEIARCIAADLTMMTDTDSEIELPFMLFLGSAAVEASCSMWLSIPEEERKAICDGDTCSIAGPKGQMWDFDAEEEE